MTEPARIPAALQLTLLLADYHRTRPILSGEVTVPGTIRLGDEVTPLGD